MWAESRAFDLNSDPLVFALLLRAAKSEAVKTDRCKGEMRDR